MAFQHALVTPVLRSMHTNGRCSGGPSSVPSPFGRHDEWCKDVTRLGLSSSGNSGKDGENKGNNNRWKRPLVLARKMAVKVTAMQSRLIKKFLAANIYLRAIISFFLASTVLLGGPTVYSSLVRTSLVKAPKTAKPRPVEVPYSLFMDLVEWDGKGHNPGERPAIQLEDVNIGRDRLTFTVKQDEDKHQLALKDKVLVEVNDVSIRSQKTRQAYARKVSATPDLVQFLRQNKIDFRAAPEKGTSPIVWAGRSLIFCVYGLILFRMYQNVMGGNRPGGDKDSPGKIAKGAKGDGPLVTFNDIEGIDTAKFEVMELVDTLRNPDKYKILGARAPTGLLLEGPPGTGKTMLARATAATAGVPLLYCSGSDFVEVFVGRGAARVRKTFARAEKLAPCIIFIDELDALGKSRDSGLFGAGMRSNDEAEQTLNQLLACMDGLDSTRRVCVLAATNRREVLDPALIRPGRFDRIIKVELPNSAGRERILRVHSSKLPGFTECSGVDDRRLGSLGKGSAVDLSAVASVTSGLSGAELEFIVNEAAIRAVRRVSAQLREGIDVTQIDSTVKATDYEESIKNFNETRRVNRGGVNMGEVLNNAFRK